MPKQLRILYPDQIYPENITGGFLRMFNLAKLASKEYKTYIFGISGNVHEFEIDEISLIQEKKYKNLLHKFKHYFNGLFSEDYSLMNSERPFNEYDFKNTIFHIEGPLVYNLIKKHKIEKFVLDQQNVYWEFSQFPSFDIKSRIYTKLASGRDKRLEIKAINAANHILACSERDKEIMSKEIPSSEDKITVVPNCINFDEYGNYVYKPKRYVKEFKVLFVGSLSYGPNIDAVNNILTTIAPNFDENVTFMIAGNNPPNLKNKPNNVKFLGFVKDLKKLINESDICIAPLNYGSGTRLKILEYMAMGKPVISTSKGAEGIDYDNNKDIIIEDNISNFHRKISDLLNDERQCMKIGKLARKLIKSRYDWQIYQKTLINIYEDVINENY